MREKNSTQATIIRANDHVLHKPSGETWVVCGVHKDGHELIPSGYPFPSLANVSDCELLEQRFEPQSEEQREALQKHGMVNYIEPVLELQSQEGYTTIIQKDSIPKDAARKVKKYIVDNYEVVCEPVVHQLFYSSVDAGYCVKATLKGFYWAESMFVYVGGYQFYIGDAQGPKPKAVQRFCDKCGHKI